MIDTVTKPQTKVKTKTERPRLHKVILGHAEFRLQDGDDKFAGREVVVDEDDLVQARPFGLGPNLGFRLGDGVDHPGGTS